MDIFHPLSHCSNGYNSQNEARSKPGILIVSACLSFSHFSLWISLSNKNKWSLFLKCFSHSKDWNLWLSFWSSVIANSFLGHWILELPFCQSFLCSFKTFFESSSFLQQLIVWYKNLKYILQSLDYLINWPC